MECLNSIIGLSRTTCECLTNDLDSGAVPDHNISNSGIFLDELEGFNLNIASAADDCAEGGIWERMQKAVENAKLDFKRNLLGCVNQQYAPRLKNFTWQLGQSTFNGTLNNVTGTHAGMRVSPAQIKGGFIYLKRIGVLINETAPVTLQVYSDVDGGTLIFENSATPVSAIANTLTWGTLAEPLELPMWNSDGHYIRYYVLMLLNGTFKPKGNKKDCGCAGARRPYDQWLELLGVSGSDTSNLLGFKSNSTYMNGIVLDVDVKCKTTEIICSSEYPLDFENDGDAMNMAVTIQLRAGARLYEDILSSPEINRFTLMNREGIQSKINFWNEQYQAAVAAICENVHLSANDCLVCKTTNTSLTKSLIRA
jgi:hypothetical protein